MLIIVHQKVKVKDLLAVKDARLEELESKMTRLEELKSLTQLEKLVQNQETNQNRVAASMPTSCVDLRVIGHALSGFYTVMGTKQVESVFCDFTKLPSDLGKRSTWLNNYYKFYLCQEQLIYSN